MFEPPGWIQGSGPLHVALAIQALEKQMPKRAWLEGHFCCTPFSCIGGRSAVLPTLMESVLLECSNLMAAIILRLVPVAFRPAYSG